jgi:cupin fold WbuC family metalloprotein
MTPNIQNPDVWYRSGESVGVSSADLELLKAAAEKSPRRRARICAHAEPTELMHDMIIALCRDGYVRPHLHLRRPESMTLIEGKADLIFYHEDGRVSEVVGLGEPHSGLPFFYRSRHARYHSLVVRSPFAVIHETTLGPFDPQDTVFPAWAPLESEPVKVASFLAAVQDQLR